MPCSVEVSNAIAVSHAAESGRGVTIEHGIVIDTDSHGAETLDETTGEIVKEKPDMKPEDIQSKGSSVSSSGEQKEESAVEKTKEKPKAPEPESSRNADSFVVE